MSKPRLELKVGVFVFIGLFLMAALMIQFSKGLTVFRPTYEINLSAVNVGGLKLKSSVLISGVQVGMVTAVRLAPSGTNVTLTLRIFKEYQIHKDAGFVIEESGFLGDKYVAIIPSTNALPVFQNGDTATAEKPFNLQEFTRTASGFISRIDDTVKKLDEALVNVTRIALTPESLTNLSLSMANLREFSDEALIAGNSLNLLLATNAEPLRISTSNLVTFSESMKDFAAGLNGLIETNSPEIHAVAKNLETSSENLKNLLGNAQAGKGLAGNLLKNEELAANVSQIVSNLSITSSNLNRLGVWGILWRPKAAKPHAGETAPLTAPKESSER